MKEKLNPELSAACEKLTAGKHTCVIVKQGVVRSFDESGVRTLMRVLAREPELLKNASVADKVVGKAAALLLALGEVREVYAATLSETAAEYLASKNIPLAWGERVPGILNRRGDGLCPMERLALKIDDPQAGYEALAEFIAANRPPESGTARP